MQQTGYVEKIHSRKSLKRPGSDLVFSIVNAILLILIAVCTLVPFLDVALMSITPTKEIVKNAKALIVIPKSPTLSHYRYVLNGNGTILRAMGVTIFRTVVGTAVSLCVTVLTAYPLSKKFLPGRNILMKYFFFTMIFSAGMIPSYLVVKMFGLTDSLLAFILPNALNVYNMIIMRTFFLGIPAELEESTRIDGCGEWKALLKVVLPLSTPVLASIGLFYAVWHWNSFFDAVLYITDRKLWPLQTLLREILLSTSMSELLGGSGSLSEAMPPSTAVINATIMISCIPIMAVYPFIQKYFVKGIMVGAIKG